MTASQRPPEPVFGLATRWYHLVRRFFGFVLARPLTPREQSEAASLLTGAEAELFFRQQYQDQRHALVVARRVLRQRPGDKEIAAAALLHDVGKVGIGLGAVQRSIATVADGLRIRLRGRYEQYRRHGPIGADQLAEVGASELSVSFARLHPGPVPAGLDEDRWQVLLYADHG